MRILIRTRAFERVSYGEISRRIAITSFEHAAVRWFNSVDERGTPVHDHGSAFRSAMGGVRAQASRKPRRPRSRRTVRTSATRSRMRVSAVSASPAAMA